MQHLYVAQNSWTDSAEDYSNLKAGNCFKSEEEAERNLPKFRNEMREYLCIQ